jgi:membrane protease YdiL (CAAX protease family)
MSTDSSKTKRVKKASWNPWLGVLIGLIALFGSQIIVGIVMSIYPFLKGWNSTTANNWLNNSISAQFIFVLLAEALAILIVYWYLKSRSGAFKSIGLRRPKWSDPLFGLMGLPAYLVLYLVAINLAIYLIPGLNVNEKQQLGFNNPIGITQYIMTFISLVVLPPIAEEIIFRGIIYSSLKKVMPLWGAVVATSLLFAAGHLPEGGSSGPLYVAAIDTFSLSLVLIYLREKTGGLWASMTLHALKNTIAFIALFAVHFT